jgi:hypothetical protein
MGHYAYGVIYSHQFMSLSAMLHALCAMRDNVLKILSDWTLPHSEPGVNEKFVDDGLHRP